MVMDGRLKVDYGLINLNAFKFNEAASILSDRNFLNAINLNETFIDRNSTNREGSLHEDSDFGDVTLKYISQMLMEEDIEEKTCMLQESAALQAAEKSFYDVLMVKEPPSNNFHPTVPSCSIESKNKVPVGYYGNCLGGNSFLSGTGLNCEVGAYESPLVPSVSGTSDSQYGSQSTFSSSSSTSSGMDGLVDSPVSTLSVSDILSDSRSLMQFQKGVEEASRFLPNGNGILDKTGISGLLGEDLKEETNAVVIKVEKKHERISSLDEPRGKKNSHSKDVVEDGRSSKQSAVYTEPTVRSKMFDDILLCNGGKNHPPSCEFEHGADTKLQQKGQAKGSNGGKGRGKKQGGRRDVVDLRTLLSLCAQSVAANDRRSATDLLKQIREHSSPTGDGMQRLAHYFSAGLEARMAGSGTEIYKALLSRPTSAVDVLKAYQLYLSCCPFTKLSNFFSNKTIMHTAQNKTKLHIIDFGILYGFQWPCLIQRLSTRLGGPPELRITGIDFPCPGFRPSLRVEETGCRLRNYAETFNVPFKFKAIAQKWDTITIEDLELDSDETLVVNCAYRFRNLLDETVMVDSPRNKVLNLIRRMNPDIFIQGIVNGSYNAPFFITRFREALFFFSSLFDMLEANVPRETQERMLIEKTIWGREAMNVIACEGGERIERPETCKQWQVRNLRAGFRQLPLNQEILKMAKERARSRYHKDFVVDEDGNWMLQGWKGRIVYAVSSWRPAH